MKAQLNSNQANKDKSGHYGTFSGTNFELKADSKYFFTFGCVYFDAYLYSAYKIIFCRPSKYNI